MTGPLISAAELRTLLSRESGPASPRSWTSATGWAGRPEPGSTPPATSRARRTSTWTRDLAAPPGAGGRHPLPETAVFEAAMRRAGVSGDRPVVVYDDWAAHAAGRAWWLLRFHGHPDVRVLDGGWSAWVADGGAVETGPGPAGEAGDFTARPGHLPLVEADDVPGVRVLVDARHPSATAARASRSTRWRATSPERSTCRPRGT